MPKWPDTLKIEKRGDTDFVIVSAGAWDAGPVSAELRRFRTEAEAEAFIDGFNFGRETTSETG